MSEKSLGEAMQAFIDKSRLKQGIKAAQVEEIWEEMMGKTISKYTDKIEIMQTTLFITTSVGPLKHELLFQKELIIRKVNEKLGKDAVSKLVIR